MIAIENGRHEKEGENCWKGRLCATASLHEQTRTKTNNEHWCSGVPATVELRQAKEKKHALVPGLSMRE